MFLLLSLDPAIKSRDDEEWAIKLLGHFLIKYLYPKDFKKPDRQPSGESRECSELHDRR